MRYAFLKTITLSVLLGLFSSLSAVAQQRSNEPLTNASVVKLVRAGFKEKTVIAIIRSHQNQFNLDPDRLRPCATGGSLRALLEETPQKLTEQPADAHTNQTT